MRLSQYQLDVRRTMPNHFVRKDLLASFGLGLGGEAGEVTELLKKHLFHGKSLDLARVEEEMGDVLWYLSALANVLMIDLESVMADNAEKLRKRYPEGFKEQDNGLK